MRRFITVGSAAAIAVAITACGGGDEGGTPSPAPAPAAAPSAAPASAGGNTGGGAVPEGATAEMVDQGQVVFAGSGLCYVCHGAAADGTQLGPDLTDSEWLNTDGSYESIIAVVTDGVPEPKAAPGPMMPRGGTTISDDEVRAVAAYVWSLSR